MTLPIYEERKYCSRIILLKDGVILEELRKKGDQEEFYEKIIKKMAEL